MQYNGSFNIIFLASNKQALPSSLSWVAAEVVVVDSTLTPKLDSVIQIGLDFVST